VRALALAVVLALCGAASAEARFDAAHGFALLKMQVAMGPRPAGSAASRTLATMLRDRLPNGRFEAVPDGLRNVVGSLPGKGPPIVLGAHYDTKDSPPGFVGAEDGAGGTAELLEVARALRKAKAPRDARAIRFVLFDGEECPSADDSPFLACGLRGSRAYVKRHPRAKAMVLLDFVAQKGLSIPRDATSDLGLWAQLRASAKAVGSGRTFPARTRGAISDDHTPFLQHGIPAIDLIDFDFPCWHRLCDDLSAVSQRSLDRSGEAVLELMRRLRRS
jgi:glutaminyl-peptide cyclotransferase